MVGLRCSSKVRIVHPRGERDDLGTDVRVG